MATTKDLVIRKGSTFTQVVRWAVAPVIYKPITAITPSAPVRVTAVGHELVEGWEVTVESVKGMTNINGVTQKVTVVDPNTVELNEVNALDFKAYVSGGVLRFNTPQSLAGFTARMDIKDKVGGTAILQLTTVNGGIVLDNVLRTITLTSTATATAAVVAKKGVYDLELVSATGIVTLLLSGAVSFIAEITT